MNLLRISQYIQRFIYVYLATWPWNYRARKLEILRELYTKSVEFMNKVGEEYWLDFGTLLGYHREKDMIAHDDDVDFSMHEKSYAKVIERKHLLPKGFRFYDSSRRHHGPKLYLNYKGFDVDIYFYEDLGGSLRSFEDTHWLNERQEIPVSSIYPLKSAMFLGMKTMVPAQEEIYLKQVYGYLGTDGNRNSQTGLWEKI